MKYKDQYEILEEMQGNGFNVCTCGNCGEVILFNSETKPNIGDSSEDVTCPHCKKTMGYSDCPDLYTENCYEIIQEEHKKEYSNYLKDWVIDTFFVIDDSFYSGWRNIAKKLVYEGYCLTTTNDIWVGGIGNFINDCIYEDGVGIYELTFNLDKFIESELFKSNYEIKLQKLFKERDDMLDNIENFNISITK